MSRDGSGTYTLPEAAFVTGTTIESAKVNNDLSDIASAMTASIAKDGQTTPTANLPMGGFKHTNVADATARTQYQSAAQAQDGGLTYASVSGTDTYTASLSPALTAYAAGNSFRLKFTNANTATAPTINLNSLGAKTITLKNGGALDAGDVAASGIYVLTYDGTNFQIDTPSVSVNTLTTRGDIVVQGSAASQRLALGTAGFVPMSDGTDLAYRAPPIQSGNVLCPHEGLIAAQASNSTATIAATSVILRNTSGGLKRFDTLSETLNIASSGANGLDTGAEASSTWYHMWAIGKEDGTLDGLLSTSSTAPTMPGGYTYKGYLGAVYNNGSSNFVAFTQVGAKVGQTETIVVSAGTATSLTSVSMTAVVPPTAKGVYCRIDPQSTSGTLQASAVIAGTSGGLFSSIVAGSSTSGSINVIGMGFTIMPTAQTIWYNVTGANMQANIYVEGWEY